MLVKQVLNRVVLPSALLCIVGLMVLYKKQPSITPLVPVDVAQKIENPSYVSNAIPDFKAYKSIIKKKQAFFAFMLPMVKQENARLLRHRQRLIALQSLLQQGELLLAADKQWLITLEKKYRLSREQFTTSQLLTQLLSRVDIVPPSLALSQSANESAWGTSRFALQANNLFGQWCFSKGCGVIPRLRPEGASYEVASFSAPVDSVVSYMHNLNTNSAYNYFRELRTALRTQNTTVSGDVLAEGLMSYSIRGEHYIDEIRQMIRINGLALYDRG